MHRNTSNKQGATSDTSLRAELSRGVFTGSALKGIGVTLKALTTIILTRNLDIESFGTYNLILNLQAAFAFVVGQGLLQALSRFVPELLERRESRAAIALVLKITLIRTVIVTAAAALILNFAHPVAKFLNIPDNLSPFAPLIVFILWLPRVTDPFGPQLRAALIDYGSIAKHDILRTTLFCFGVILIASSDSGLTDLLYLLTAAKILSTLVYAAFLLRSIFLSREKAEPHKENETSPQLAISFKRVARYSLYTSLHGFVALAVGPSIDSIVVAHFFGPSDVASYTFAYGLVISVYALNPATFLKSLFLNMLTRRFTQTRSLADLAHAAESSSRIALSFALPSLVGLCLLSGPIIAYIYNPTLHPATRLMPFFSAMCIARTFSLGLFGILSTLELARYLAISNLIGVGSVTLGIAFAPILGPLGVAIATCFGGISWCLYLYWVATRKGSVVLSYINLNVLRILTNTGGMALVLLMMLPSVQGILSLLFVCLSGALTYLVLSWLNLPFNAEERKLIRNLLKVPEWVL